MSLGPRGTPPAVSRPAVIVDTNVVVAGFPIAGNELPVARILEGMLSAAFAFVLSEDLLTEYRDVLARPALRKLHGLADAEMDRLVSNLARHATLLTPVSAPPAPDPGDQMLWELLSVRADLMLVTSDKRLLRDARMRGRIISPQVFLAGA